MKRFPVLTTLKLLFVSNLLLAGLAVAGHSPELPPPTKPSDAVCMLNVDGILQLNKASCRIYINGFLDGAELTDSVIIDKVRDSSAFFERAYATRVGSAKGPLPVTYYADFCLGKGADRQQVIDRVIEQLEQNKNPVKDERSAVYGAIKRLYPCDAK